jgi:hypothetical protein
MAYPTPGIAQTTCLCDDSIVGLWGKDLISRGDTGKIRPCGRMISARFLLPESLLPLTEQSKATSWVQRLISSKRMWKIYDRMARSVFCGKFDCFVFGVITDLACPASFSISRVAVFLPCSNIASQSAWRRLERSEETMSQSIFTCASLQQRSRLRQSFTKCSSRSSYTRR